MSENPTKFRRVMVIDDNEIDLYIASRIINKSKFADDILTYNEARKALEYLRSNEENIDALPEIIFVDIYMPEMSGFEFMAAFNTLSDSVKERCRAYIISSTIDENDINLTKADKNITAFQEKPINIEFLYSIPVSTSS